MDTEEMRLRDGLWHANNNVIRVVDGECWAYVMKDLPTMSRYLKGWPMTESVWTKFAGDTYLLCPRELIEREHYEST